MVNSLVRPTFYNERGEQEKTGERFWTRKKLSYDYIAIEMPVWKGEGNKQATWVELASWTTIVSPTNALVNSDRITVYGKIEQGVYYMRMDIRKYLDTQWSAGWRDTQCVNGEIYGDIVESLDKIQIVIKLPANATNQVKVEMRDCTVDSISFMWTDTSFNKQFNADIIYARRGFIGTLHGEADTTKRVKNALKAYWGTESVVYNGSANVSIYT